MAFSHHKLPVLVQGRRDDYINFPFWKVKHSQQIFGKFEGFPRKHSALFGLNDPVVEWGYTQTISLFFWASAFRKQLDHEEVVRTDWTTDVGCGMFFNWRIPEIWRSCRYGYGHVTKSTTPPNQLEMACFRMKTADFWKSIFETHLQKCADNVLSI